MQFGVERSHKVWRDDVAGIVVGGSIGLGVSATTRGRREEATRRRLDTVHTKSPAERPLLAGEEER